MGLMKQSGDLHVFDPARLITRTDLVIPGDVKAIAPAIESIIKLVQEMGCATGKEFEIELALNEALANAVKHGCANDPTKRVEVWVGCDHDRGVLVVIRDPGPGFNPEDVPSPTLGERVFSEGGRGIFLINQLMDEVHFGRGGTEIRMVKR